MIEAVIIDDEKNSRNILKRLLEELDLDVNVSNEKFEWHLFDKRRSFPFKVISFPNIKSNIPENNSYNLIIGELYRIAKSSSKLEFFLADSRLFISKLIKQNFKVNLVSKVISKFLNIRPACINRFWHSFRVEEFLIL